MKTDVSLVRGTAKRMRMTTPKIPPMVDAISANPRLLPTSPFRVRGLPSSAVGAAAGVTGVLIRAAVIDPPKFEAI